MALVDDMTAALAAAIATYGQDVWDKVDEVAADATVGLGLKLLRRIKGAKHPALQEAVTDAADNPADEDFAAALRAQLKKAIGADTELGDDFERLVRSAPGAIVASGERSVAVAHNSGIIATGDKSENRIGR